MIYAASLGSAVKRSQKDKAFVTQIGRIIQQMPLDPDTSGMDAVILGPKDVVGPNGPKVQSAINNKHPDLCVIYIYSKDEEKSLVTCEYSRLIKKVDNNAITSVVTEVLGDHMIKIGKLDFESNDFKINGSMTPITERVASAEEEPEPEAEPEAPKDVVFNIPNAIVDPTTGAYTPDIEEPDNDDESVADEFVAEQKEEAPAVELDTTAFDIPQVPQTPDIQDEFQRIREFKDFDIFKRALAKDRIISKVLDENTTFAQVTDMLKVLDHNIQLIFADPFLSAEEKYNRIKTAGLQRSNFKAQANTMIIDMTKSIFDKVTTLTEEFVDERVNTIEKALKKVTIDKQEIMQGGVDIDHLIEERTKMELELMELIRNILDIYKSMDVVTADELAQLDTQLPSSNSFINQMLSPDKSLFTPANTSALATALMKSLQDQRIKLSALESRVKCVIDVIFQICAQSDEIIKYQANLIKLLRANRVEDVVVIDTMIKGALRLYVGAKDTGATATVLTHSGILSRTANTLIIDMSGTSRWADYGITPYSWNEFVASRPEEPLCVVNAPAGDPEEIHEVVMELKKALDYYRYINVKLSYKQRDAIGQLSTDAVMVHFITDCRTSNIAKIASSVSAVETANIARKAVLIDPPTHDIIEVIKQLNLDITTTKVVPIPHITEMKSCSITRKRPFDNKDIVQIFEGAFK